MYNNRCLILLSAVPYPPCRVCTGHSSRACRTQPNVQRLGSRQSAEETHHSVFLSRKRILHAVRTFGQPFTDLSMTMTAAVPKALWVRTRSSKSIRTSSHTCRGMMGVEEPPGITPNRLLQPPLTPPAPTTLDKRGKGLIIHRVNPSSKDI